MEPFKQDDSISQNSEQKKTPRKVSFKCRKSSVYRHSINSNTTTTSIVAYLTSKFNEIDAESELQEAGKNLLMKHINSYKAAQVEVDKLKRPMKKPSVKMKPAVKLEESVCQVAQVERRSMVGNVRATIENFERRNSEISSNVPKPLVPLKEQERESNKHFAQAVVNQSQTKTDILKVQMLAMNAKDNVHIISPLTPVVPNTSFLWRKRSQELHTAIEVDTYEIVGVNKIIKSELVFDKQIKDDFINHSYEYCRLSPNYEDLDSSAQSTTHEDIYETIPCINRISLPPTANKQEEPLPLRPTSWTGHCDESIYESIYNTSKITNQSDNYETICDYNNWEVASNQSSSVSDHKSNSLYDRAPSVCSTINNEQSFSDTSCASDKSDEWIDVSDNENPDHTVPPFVVIRARHRNRPTGWTQKIRDQRNKTQSEKGDSEADHHYETLYSTNEDHKDIDSDDSFESDTEGKISTETYVNNLQLPEPPTYGLTKLAVSAGKHMKRLRKNWSLTKSDITKSFKRIRKRKSVTDLEQTDNKNAVDKKSEDNQSLIVHNVIPSASESNSQLADVVQELKSLHVDLDTNSSIENKETDLVEKRRSDGFLNKFRRSLTVSSSDFTQTLGNRTKSTFYLTETIDVDKEEEVEEINPVIKRHSKTIRPQSPPPPIPVNTNTNENGSAKVNKENRRTTSWYAEVGLFKNSDNVTTQRPNSSWYAEVGLYHTSTGSTPNTSSTENSGNTANSNVSPKSEYSEEYYNLRNETESSNNSISTVENCYNNQLRLQDEPLYQFYDAAIFDGCMEGFDSDEYEDIHDSFEKRLSIRPSAMELISPSKSGILVSRTLWCEIPEVLQSTVLSTLSTHQKKIQEAKFEMITSEASYLKSLNILWDHFGVNLNDSNLLNNDEKYTLFGKIRAVKRCSKNLLLEMEKCWQDNILLHGICDIVKKHVDSNFIAYVPYCENQILLDSTLRKIRERNNCSDFLKHLEGNSVCQSLSLYSFLLLPMQRITRWPLLIDAVLKRLSPEDDEYETCQCTLGALNKIVGDCNEAARKKEQETEITKISKQLCYPKSIPIINFSTTRWLIRSGPLVHLQARADDVRLTFGKRLSKLPINLFLFNDLLLICKPKNDGNFSVLHYCFRSYIELNSDDTQNFSIKETQGRHLFFLTMLENHEGKTIEMLLACSSESDKERWIEALSTPKSDNPDEILYDCWDCPQVTAVHSYNASQPDELALNRGDVVNIDRKMADGWYHGERLRDGQTGWFPGNHTIEIANPHVRARNLKQRYRFLALSHSYLKTK